MIPSDLATRLRAFIESQVNPLAALKPVADELPRYEQGQRFTALIQNPLPDGTFRAIVAGRTLTLALPDTAKSGDVLELVVTGREGSTVAARYADDADIQPATPQARPALSQAGQLISQLLTGRFSQADAVPLRGGEPVLATPPHDAAEVAPQLQQAVKQSGLFFESHQAKWLAGSLPLEQLLAEPQMKLMRALTQPGSKHAEQAPDQTEAPPMRADANTPTTRTPASTTSAPTPTPQSPQRTEQQAAALAAAIERTIPPPERESLRIPERLMPLVHQQLETLATHQAQWQGQIWPGQQMQWTVFDPEQHAQGGLDEEVAPWSSSIRLTLPSLGGVNAHLVLSPQGLALRVEADEAATTARLLADRQSLADALNAAGIALTSMTIHSGGETHGRT